MLLINGVTGAIGSSLLRIANERQILTCGIGRDQNKLAILTEEFPDSFFYCVNDVADELEASRILKEIEGERGVISMYLHAAAFLKRTDSPIETDLVDFQESLRVNLEGTFIWNKQVLRNMVSNHVSGSILNMSSQAARTGGFGGNVSYAAAKGGVETLTRSFARYGASYGVRVNAIAPGFVNNEMMIGNLTASQRDFFVEKTLLGRFADNDEIAKTCLFLLTEESSYMTAEIIEVSAGQKIG
jgi:3-oxoacyl-[acyl-carrier protein] reductase